VRVDSFYVRSIWDLSHSMLQTKELSHFMLQVLYMGLFSMSQVRYGRLFYFCYLMLKVWKLSNLMSQECESILI